VCGFTTAIDGVIPIQILYKLITYYHQYIPFICTKNNYDNNHIAVTGVGIRRNEAKQKGAIQFHIRKPQQIYKS